MNLYIAELKKLRHKTIYLLMILLPTIITLFLLNKASNTEDVAGEFLPLYVGRIAFIGIFVPMFVVYLVIIMTRIEWSNNGLRNLLTLGVKRQKVYFTKVLVVISIIACMFIIFLLELFILEKIAGKNLLNSDFFIQMIIAFLAMLPFAIFEYEISRRCESPIIPAGVGITLILSTALIIQSKYNILFPWTYSLMAVVSGGEKIGNIIFMSSLSIFIFFGIIILGVRNFCKKDIA